MIDNREHVGGGRSGDDSAREGRLSSNGGRSAIALHPRDSVPFWRGSVFTVPPWHRIAVGAVLALAAFLDFFRLWDDGDGNLYYAAAVRSMLASWHDFFFVAFDPGGFVSVDKPPLDLWIQTASAALFGFRGFSLFLPQALAGVLSVGLLYHLVQRAFGRVSGLLAALVLALTPISVATNRNNTMDSLLVLVVLFATWAVTRATEGGRLRWLLLGGVLVGIGFEVKMLEAYLVLPALALLYLVCAPLPWRTRLWHLALAGTVMLAVSLAWPVTVDLTPANLRPYVGSSTDNSELELIIGHNGLQRLLPRGFPGTNRPIGSAGHPTSPPSTLFSNGTPNTSPGVGARTGRPPANAQGLAAQFGFGIGARGPQRFVDPQLAGQISWLLPLALIGLVVAGWQVRLGTPRDRQYQSVLLWGTWLISQGTFFSVASMFASYYLVMFAPAVAALAGIGLVAMWQDYRGHSWQAWVLPTALLVTALFEATIVVDAPSWTHGLIPLVVGVCLLAAGVLVLRRLGRDTVLWPQASLIVGAAMLALLVAPAFWAAIPAFHADAARPIAGPALLAFDTSDNPMVGTTPQANPKLVDYLLKNQDSAPYLLATLNANVAAPIILETGQPVMALGGFMGSDPILSTDQLAQKVRDGTVRFFLLPERTFQQASLEQWVQTHCSTVPSGQWQTPVTRTSAPSPGRGFGGFGRDEANQLYDCAGVASSASAAGPSASANG